MLGCYLSLAIVIAFSIGGFVAAAYMRRVAHPACLRACPTVAARHQCVGHEDR